MRLTNLLLTSRLYLVLIARFEENSRLSTLTLVTFEVKVALGLESTITDGLVSKKGSMTPMTKMARI